MKKVQQAIAMPGTLERFFPDPNEAEMIVELRASFAGMWGLGNEDEDTKNIINDAIENPGNYVLKPSKEGGGNNTWGDEIAEKLKAFTKKQLEAHILMQRLKPIVGKVAILYGSIVEAFGLFAEKFADFCIEKRALSPTHANVINAICSGTITILGINISGMYANPIVAWALTFNCKGISHLGHISVYWLAPICAFFATKSAFGDKNDQQEEAENSFDETGKLANPTNGNGIKKIKYGESWTPPPPSTPPSLTLSGLVRI
ncbi:hypothetical protein niasHT_030068 [Heterodera trifolii]|uniref:Uncharacterized protein n=1 Tax=Heterodera trifolii TaxID=157864 RepID=A0ABD2JQI5_9BILA